MTLAGGLAREDRQLTSELGNSFKPRERRWPQVNARMQKPEEIGNKSLRNGENGLRKKTNKVASSAVPFVDDSAKNSADADRRAEARAEFRAEK